MTRLIQRLISSLLLMVAISIFTFLLADLAPGDYLSEMQLNPRISPETIAALRARYGLDDPLPVRYLSWLRSIASGELGYSFARDMPVGPLIWPRARNTLLLTVLATALAWMIAIPLGAWAAARPAGWLDRSTTGVSTLLIATPEVLLGLAGLLIAVRTGWFPVGGMSSPGSDDLAFGARVGDLAWHFVLPVTVLVLSSLPVLLRHVRSAMVEALDAPFVHAARSYGIGRRRLLFHYALPAAANPLISLFGLSIAGLLSGSFLIEVIMSWPGLGPLLLASVLARDLHVVVAAILLSGALLIAGNLLADLLLYAVDPRIRRPG